MKARSFRASIRLFNPLTALALVAALTACGPDKKSSPDGGGSDLAISDQLRFLSFPIHNARTGDSVRYRPVVSATGATFTLTTAPAGATLGNDGTITWTPTGAQSGAQSFTVHAVAGSASVDQSFTVTVAQLTVQATQTVDPANPNGGTVSVDAPLSPIHGAAVTIAPGALSGSPLAITISSVDHAPVPPSATLAGVAASALTPVELGPSGTTFQRPVSLTLPVSAAVLALGMPEVQTYDFTTGQWQRVPVVSVDATNGVVVASASHFSLYVAAPPSQFFDLSIDLGQGASCTQTPEVRAPLHQTFGEIPASAVNGAPGAGTLAALLSALPAGSALQVLITIDVTSAEGKSAHGWQLASATNTADGKLAVTVGTNTQPGGLLTIPAELSAADAEPWLNGSRVASLFPSINGGSTAGVTVTAGVSFYLVPIPNATMPPPVVANSYGTDTRTASQLTPLMNYDADCDGAPDAYDAQPNGAPPPLLYGDQPSPVQLAVGGSTTLHILGSTAGVSFNWMASDPSVSLSVNSDGTSTLVRPTVPGFFHVQVVGTAGSTTSSFGWDLIVTPNGVAMAPPKVGLASSAQLLRVGDTATLNAVGFDPNGAPLNYRWSAQPSVGLTAMGALATFTPVTAGDYTITVIGNDGTVDSAPASVVLSVLAADANRPPNPPLVTPMAPVLQHGPGVPASVTLVAQSSDPDGDTVTYSFSADATAPPTYMLTSNGASATFTADADGFYLIYVTARDSHGAVSPWTPIKVQVVPTLPAQPVDADGDGFPAGIDCNDNDPTIHPGAVEICGDGIDQNCDGSDLSLLDCDADHDRFSIRAGDCVDTDPAINPGVAELCDGKDNNCNGLVDEGYQVGVACSAGVGACAASGTTQCDVARYGSSCNAVPGAPSPEVCDGIDNDCDGAIDDVSGNTAGTVSSCGGCNVTCAAPPNTAPACSNGGCVAPCQSGYVDVDHAATNGCECHITNGGIEICDGQDNDCNGLVDDNTNQVSYSGPPGTVGIGVCRAGVSTCLAGSLTVTVKESDPSPEICDGLDNDCNGKVDETFNLASDPLNCGSCGTVCATGTCSGGKCGGSAPLDMTVGRADMSMGTNGDAGVNSDAGTGGSSCAPPSVSCNGGACTFLTDDAANCGACGKSCAPGQVCNASLCVAGGASNFGGTCMANTDCAGGLACLGKVGWPGGFCAPFCDAGCATGQSCVTFLGDNSAGVCLSACSVDTDCATGLVCDGKACQPDCRKDSRCRDGQTCNGTTGHCDPYNADLGTSPCSGSFVSCGAQCSLLTDDVNNCGSCGHACAANQVCSASTCVAAGPGAFGAACTTSADCGSGEVCLDQPRTGWPNGFCSTFCPSANCAAAQSCTVLVDGSPSVCLPSCMTDADCKSTSGANFCNQGVCQPNCQQDPILCHDGTSCDATGHCTVPSGPSCSAGFTNCAVEFGLSCRLLSDDPASCGSCGHACGATEVCSNGSCVPAGSGAFAAPCTSNTDCSAGSVCLDATRTGFSQGLCSAFCYTQPCSGPTNEKCSDYFGDGASVCLQGCGTDKDCSSGALCNTALGICRPDCRSTPEACPSGTTCGSDGRCASAGCGPGLTICPSGCASLSSDPANCGGCGITCQATQSCISSSCQTSGCTNGQTLSCYDGPGGTAGVGVCVSGTQMCLAGAYGKCVGEVVPTPEQCGNFLDDDCNGTVDDGCALELSPNGTIVLAGSSLTFTAAGGVPPYTFAMQSAPSGGAVASGSGIYTAGAAAGNDMVRVTDKKSASQVVNVNVVTTPVVTLSPASATSNQPKLQIAVRTVVGGSASYTVDGAPQGSIVLAPDGTGFAYVDSGGKEGSHTVVVTATTSAGPASVTGSYTFDFTPPGAPTITSPSDGSSVAGPSVPISGTVDATATQLQILDGTTVVTTIPLTGDGTFSSSVPPLATGQHLLSVSAVDGAGNVSTASAAVLVTVTNGTPLALVGLPTNATVDAGQALRVYAQGGTPPYQVALTGNASGGSVDGSGHYQAGAVAGSDIVTFTDATSATTTVTITVEGPLSATITSPTNNQTIATPAFNVTVQTSAGAKATLLIDGAAAGSDTANATGQVTFPANAPDGPHTLTVQVSLDAQSATSPPVSIVVSTMPPTATITSPTANQILPAGPLTIVGRTSANANVQIVLDMIPVAGGVADPTGNFDIPIPGGITVGAHTVYATVTLGGPTGQSATVSFSAQ